MNTTNQLEAMHADPLYLTALASLGQNVPAKLTATPSKYSIAVLPFANMSSDVEQEHLVDGLTEDIITDLSNVPGFFVIARNSVFTYKGKPADVRRIAHDLGVKYVLEGSARRAGQRLRINVQLIDAAGGGSHIWAERFDRDFTSIFELQDEVTRQVVDAIVGKLNSSTRNDRARPGNLLAYDLCVRARNLWTQSSVANNEAVALFNQALALDPNFAEAHWRLGLSQLFCWLQYSESPDTHRTAALSSVQRAIAIDPNDGGARWALGFVLEYENRWEEARKEFLISIAMNPNDADAHSIYSDFLFLDGSPEGALESAAMALRLDPHPPGWHIWLLGQAQIACGQYELAVATLSKEETYRTSSRRILAVALALLGRFEEAKHEVSSYLASDPDWRFGNWMASRPFQKKEDIKFWTDAYRLSGLQE
jgi:adenylate cyclase